MWMLWISALVAVADQAAKSVVRSRFLPGEGVSVVPGLFDLRYVRNTGAAWGLFSGFSHLLVVVSLVMLALLLRYRRALMGDARLARVAGGLMVGGIVGNLIDRVRLGYVVDYLDFYWRESHFPAFNIADAAICGGVGLYLLLQWLEARREARAPAPPAEVADGAA